MARIRVKICGMTRRADIDMAIQLGVDAIGLIFYEKSPRYLSIEKARTLLVDLPPFVDVVGVFVNPSSDAVQTVIQDIPLNLLQFHGSETNEFCSQFGLPFLKAVLAESENKIAGCANLYKDAAAILLDTPHETQWGGTGEAFDWSRIPTSLPLPIVLAGGINLSNVSEALAVPSVYAIDVCSGLEQNPGIKDSEKMKQFMQLVREAS